MAPRDAADALLCSQMAAIHQATMMMARRLNQAETLTQQEAAERALNKPARTYAAQIEALKRYRGTGQQKVVVEHVTVNAGGQAIVGTVTRGRGAGGGEMTANPIHPTQRLQAAPRCHATAKTTGQRCLAPAVQGWAVCRMHGARGGAPEGKANGARGHGGRTLEAIEMRRLIQELDRLAWATLGE